ncbi:MAG: lactate utilization protein [Deltaproteobacteria bacterium]|nr:lactate utilization protein [Deltaproteobacteria bacterium]MBI3077318.1 lactate utilization protein [Deltaproteobacteria bacterium]
MSQGTVSRTTWVERLCQELTAVGGHYHQVASGEEVARVIIDVARSQQLERVVLWRGAMLDGLALAGRLGEAGLHVAVIEAGMDREQARRLCAEADVGITEVDFALAETGSLVLASGPGHPRLASALPRVHMAVLDPRTVVPDFETLLGQLQAGDLLRERSNLAFITGPSRTADIELTLTRGVHGPREVHLLIHQPA